MSNLHPSVALAQQLIQIDSQNPVSTEMEIVSFIGEWLGESGVPYELQEVKDGRSNLIARVRGDGSRPPIILIAHMDTVPVGEGWTEKPLAGEVRGGKIFGRGAADMKAGLAASLYAIQKASGEESLPGDFVVIASIDEEGPDMAGIKALLDAGYIGKDSLIIAPEPTGLEVIRAHRGAMWYEIVTRGVSVHCGHADLGVDANHALVEILSEIKAAVAALPYDDPMLKRPLVSIGHMSGGEKTNIVPNFARAEVDFRIVPPLTAQDANDIIIGCADRAVLRVPGALAEVRNLGLQRGPIMLGEDAEIIGYLEKSYRKVMGQEPVHGGYVAYTDAAVVSLLTGNENAICFGPGSLEQAHTLDEWASVHEIEQCAEIFLALALSIK